VYHRSEGATRYGFLHLTNAFATSATRWNNTAPTDTQFYLGNDGATNGSGGTFVAYLFAHDPLGPSGDGSDGLIACGSYTGNGSTNGPEITLGWEPQWILVKNASGATDWWIVDTMRGMPVGGNDWRLRPNTSDADNNGDPFFAPIATGFKLETASFNVNFSGNTYIYIAIRRGPMREPTSGTEVFSISSSMSGAIQPAFNASHIVDMGMQKRPAFVQDVHIASRLTGTKNMYTNKSDAELTQVENVWDFMDGWGGWTVENPDYRAWNFRRAPGFFDVVTFNGVASGNATVYHNLGVSPELIITKRRDSDASFGLWYTSAIDFSKIGALDSSGSFSTFTAFSSITSSSFETNRSSAGTSSTYIAYLFATLPGVSKVGSYTGNGSSQTINCGFTGGARFVLIKRTSASGDWYVWDTDRGIVSGNDPHLSLNTTAAEVTSDDSIDPDSSGFIVNQVSATNVNVSSASYIYLAIA
jgi:hypothetical protein